MRRDVERRRLVAAALGLSLLAACVGPPDAEGLGPPYFARDLAAAGVPASCTADDLAMADTVAPIADDASHVVVLLAGEALCLAAAPAAPVRAREEIGTVDTALSAWQLQVRTDAPGEAPPSWITSDETTRVTKSGGSQSNQVFDFSVTDNKKVIQDPTPQPARPGQSDIDVAAPPPAPPGNPTGSDN